MDGLEATRLISGAADTEDVRVLILTTFDLDEYVYEALRAGASGFLLKDTPPDRPARRDPGGGRRRRSARPERHPAAHRGVRRAARRATARRPPPSTYSPTGSARC